MTTTTVGILSGEVQRTWIYKNHTIDLFHDTLSGVRFVSLDFEELPGSSGTTPLFSREPHRLKFSIGEARGVVILEKAGMMNFKYTCVVDGIPLNSTLQRKADAEEEEGFSVRIEKTSLAYSSNENAVTWYELTVERKSDGARTIVYRRYREFQHLFEQVSSGFKGNHLRSSLPDLPGRQIKLLVDHTDAAFVEERRAQLHSAMQRLLAVPHVCSMFNVQIFLGFFEKLKEHSVVLTQKDSGLTIAKVGQSPDVAIIVSKVDTAVVAGTSLNRVMVGDTLSKINGEAVSKFVSFEAVQLALSRGLRPMVIHFLQQVDRNKRHEGVSTSSSTSSSSSETASPSLLAVPSTVSISISPPSSSLAMSLAGEAGRRPTSLGIGGGGEEGEGPTQITAGTASLLSPSSSFSSAAAVREEEGSACSMHIRRPSGVEGGGDGESRSAGKVGGNGGGVIKEVPPHLQQQQQQPVEEKEGEEEEETIVLG